ncbi:SH3 domain-containing protein [Streptomyces sp. NPDC058989]|uniref:SH3 domain-containing protein n=1 Tax=Streptomyces sp. NPDC058989 TaxID=3346686 RepID=UPI0036BDD296
MRSARIAVSAAVLGALALPLISAPSATAAPASSPAASAWAKPGPWKVHTQAVTIRSKPDVNSTAVGILYRSQGFTVHKTVKSGFWVYITDRSTGVRGWVSGNYVYRDQ